MEFTHGLVSASAVSRVMAVNSSHVKGGGRGQAASEHPFTRGLPRDLPSHASLERRDWSEFHRPQSTSSNLERVWVLPSHTPWEQAQTKRYKCDFEQGSICSFLTNTEGNAENWRIGRGKLTVADTGPSVDHTTGS
ncbi:hypothetical protein AVEN_239893-1, partial [Araneus ventricosus]